MIALPPRRSVRHAAVREETAHAGCVVREAGPADSYKPRLLDRVRAALRARHYSSRTEDAYVAWIKRYIFFHGKRHPAEMSAPEVTRFLTAHAVNGHVAASTKNQALSALLFLCSCTVTCWRSTTQIYTHVLNRGPSGVRSPLDGMLDA